MIPLRQLCQPINRWIAILAAFPVLMLIPSATQGQVVYDPHPRDFATHRLVLDDGTNNGFWGILRLTGTLTSDIYIDFPADATGPVIRGNSTGGQSITGGLTVDDLALSTPLSPIYGGTGFSSYAIGDILYANTATSLARRAIGSEGQVMVVQGGLPQWSNSNVFSSTGGATPITGINSGDITAGLPEAVTNIGYNDAGGANGPSTTNIAGNTNIGSGTGDNGGPTTTTVNGNANFTGTATFATAPTIPLATDNIWRGVGGVQTAYAPGAAGTVLTVVGTTPTWSATIGSSSAPENVLGGPLNLNSTAAGSPSTTNINASPATGGTTNVGNGTSTTNVAGTTNLTGPATLSGATTTISSPTTNINTAPNAGGTTTIGNPTSTTQLNGTVNFTNPPSIPLAQNAVWVGNASNVQQAYNSTNVNGAVLAQNSSGTPTWTTTTVLTATTGSAPVTNINNGDVNNGSGTESVTNIGYNDPDGGVGANAASTTNINGNTNLGSNTGSGGGPTTTTVLGTTNLQGPTTNINTAPNAGGTTTVGNPTSTTQLNGTVNFANAPTIPLNQNAIWVGNASNQQQAYASTNVPGAVLAQNASGTPVWSTTSNLTSTAPAAGGAVTNINNGDVNSGNNSEATTNIGYNDPDGATATNAASQTNILGNTNLGSNTGSGGGPTTTTVLGTTNLQGPTTNINTAPNAGGTTTIGNPTSTTQLNGAVSFANAPTIPLATDNIWRGVGGVQTAYAPGTNGTVLQIVGTTPTWSTTNNFSTTAPAGGGAVTNINNGDVNSGNNSEATTNIGYNDPDGATATNAASQTNILGNTNLGSNTGSGGGPTTTTVLGTTNLQGPTTNINTAPNAGGTTTIGNPTSTTQLNGTVSFANAPTIPLNQNAIWVGNASNQQQAYASTNVHGAVLTQNASGTPVWSTTSNLTSTAPAAGGAVTNINNGDVNSGNNSEATTNIGYNDPDGATATNAASQTNIFGNTNLGSNTGSGGGATTTSVAGNTNINASNPNSGTVQTTTIGYNDPDAGGGNAASQTTVLGNINLNNTSPGSTSPQTTTIGYNDPDGSGGNVPSQTTILGNTNINATNPNSPTGQATTIGYNDPDGGGPNAASTTTVLGTTNLQGPTTNINTAPNAGGTTTIGNPTSTTQLNGTVNFANAPTIPLATDNLWVGVAGVQTAYPPGVAGSVLSVVGTTPTWSSANVLNAVGGLAPITNINAQDNNVGGGTEAVTNIGYDDLSSGGADNPSQTNIRGNTNLGSNNGNNGGATTTSVVGNTNINASNPNSPTTQTTTVGYNDPDGAGANVASTTNILGTTNLSGSTNNIGTTDNTLAGAPESQITIGYNDPDGGGPNGPSSTTINGNVTFANAPAIPLATDNIWRGVGGVQTAYAPGSNGTVLQIVGTTPTWSTTNNFSTTAPAAGGAVTNINSGDVNSGNNSEATTNIGYNDPDGATATNAASQTNILGNTNLGSNTGSGGGATTTSVAGNTNINASNPGSSVVQTTNIGYNDPDGAGANAASQTTVLGNINLNNTSPGSTSPQTTTIGYNDPDAGGGNVPSQTTINGNTNINAGPVSSPTSQTTTIGYNDPDAGGANVASTTTVNGNTNLGSNTGSGGGPTTTTVLGTTNLQGATTNINTAPNAGGTTTIGNPTSTTQLNGTVSFANAPTIPLATDNLWVGVGGVQTAYAPGTAGTVLTVVGTTPTWSNSIGNSSTAENVVGGPLNLNSTLAGSPSTTNINAAPATGGTTNVGNGTSTTNVAGTTNLTGPATLSGTTTTISSPTTNINTAPNAGGTTTIGNPTSTTQLNGTVSFANAPTIPLATDNIWRGVGGVQTAYAPGTNGTVLQIVGTTPTWSTTNNFSTTAPAAGGAVTNINSGDVNSGNNSEATTNIGYNDPDGATATNAASQTNILGNTNLGSNTGSGGGATTTSVAGNTNINASNPNSGTVQTTNIGYNDPDGAGANAASQTTVLGNINLNNTSPGSTSPQTTTIGYNDPDAAGANVPSQTTILGNTNINATNPNSPTAQVTTVGYNDPDGGGPNSASSTVFNGSVTFTNPPSLPLATNNVYVGVGGVATALPPTNSSVFITDGSGVPQWQTISSFLPATAWALAGNASTNPATQYLGSSDDQDISMRTNGTERARIYSNTNGGGFGITNAFRPGGLAGSTGQVLTSTGSTTAPVWTASGVLNAVGGSAPITGLNNGDINNGSGTESVTNIGYNDPDGAAAGNGPSVTNINGTTNIGSATGNGGGPTTTTFSGNVVFNTAPSLPLTNKALFVGNASNLAVALPTTNVPGAALIQDGTGTPVWSTTPAIQLAQNNIWVGNASNQQQAYAPTTNGAMLVLNSSLTPVWSNANAISSTVGANPATNINTGDINSGTATESATTIGYNDPDGNTATNGPSTTTVLGDINLNSTNPNKSAPQTTLIGYNDPDAGGGNVPSQTTILGNTNINATSPNSPNTQTTTIGYNDPDGAGTSVASTTNILGNTNIGSATGPTTTTFFGNVVLPAGTSIPLAQNNMFVGNASNVATALPPVNSAVLITNGSGVPQWQTIATFPSNAWSLNGNTGTTPGVGVGQNFLGATDDRDVVFASNNLERARVLSTTNGGGFRISNAFLPNGLAGSSGQVLTSTGSSTAPAWTSSNVLSALGGATPVTGINSGDVNPGTNSESTTNIGYNDPDGATATNGPSVTNIRGNTTIGNATGDGGGPTTTTINGNMVFGNPSAIRSALGIYSGRVANSTGSNTTTVTVTGATFTASTVIEISWEEAGAGSSTYLQYKIVNRSAPGGNQFTVSFSATPPAGFINYIVHQ